MTHKNFKEFKYVFMYFCVWFSWP